MNTEEKNKELKEKILKEVGYYVPYICKSNEWSNKAHQDIISLGNLQLSKKPLKDNWGDDWNDNPSDCNSGSAYDNDLWLELETNKKVIYTKEDILKAIDLTFDEATKQAEKRFIEKVSSISLEDFDKFIDKLKSELNCSLPSNFDCDETALKVVDNLASELKQKLTNHTPKEQTKPDRVKSDKGRSNAVILQNETPIRRDKSVSAETIKTQEKRNE